MALIVAALDRSSSVCVRSIHTGESTERQGGRWSGHSHFACLLLKWTLNFKPGGVHLTKHWKGSYQESRLSVSGMAACPSLSQMVVFLSPHFVPLSSKLLRSTYWSCRFCQYEFLKTKRSQLYCFLPFQNFYSLSLPSTGGQVPTRGDTVRLWERH